MDDRLSTAEAAAYVGCSVGTIRQYARQGRLIPIWRRSGILGGRPGRTFNVQDLGAMKLAWSGVKK